ncbi:hypothetical protein AB0425_12430 [Actinosynnema sp. NPDC051121]
MIRAEPLDVRPSGAARDRVAKPRWRPIPAVAARLRHDAVATSTAATGRTPATSRSAGAGDPVPGTVRPDRGSPVDPAG